jgi:predicted RNA-binding protein with PUA-like domain
MAQQYWLVKSEPEAYSWSNLVRDGKTAWTGVRNFQARNNLRAMNVGDLVLFYHSVNEKMVVGLARVERAAYSDPTASEGDWSCVDLAPVRELKVPVTLGQIKSDKTLKALPLVTHGRLSVMPLLPAQFARLLDLGDTPAAAQGLRAKRSAAK